MIVTRIYKAISFGLNRKYDRFAYAIPAPNDICSTFGKDIFCDRTLKETLSGTDNPIVEDRNLTLAPYGAQTS